MKMDINLLDNDMEDIEENSADQLLASCLFLDEIFGDPQMIPRVGYQYQAEIPPLVEDCHSLQVITEPLDSKVIKNVPSPSPMGLPIPVSWTKTGIERMNGAFEFESRCHEYKVESLYSVAGDQEPKPTAKTKMEVDLLFLQKPNSKLNQVDNGLCPLPVSSSEAWKDVERDGFLLGLYIFGKNLILMKDFVGTKDMGQMLSFYYGKFYGSDGYRRWSECQKLQSRRFVHGQKLFTGWRQQELSSRLFSNLSKECQDMLLEVSKRFGEGKVSLEEYVFTLKNTVSLSMLIEAIGIGKGKRDLTSNAMEPVKASHIVSFLPKVPIGKACSALTSVEIIKFLTGDFRLSKARSSDLFWEAVWPRLLARGWHSEQPKDQVFSGLKNSLVFLVPGVNKFSRKRLVKGNHYFDSVSDLLNKVASEPRLLELETETPVPEGSRENKENKWDPVIEQSPDCITDKHKRYLKPRNSGCNQDVMKFTIVDTSLVQGNQQSKVRELRSLPIEATSLGTPSSISGDSEEATSDDSEETSTSNAAEAKVEGVECMDLSDCVNSNSNIGIPHSSESIVSVENHSSLPDDHKEKVMKLTDCFNRESNCSVGNIASKRMLNEEHSHCRLNQPSACEDMVFQSGSENLSPGTSLSKDSADKDKEIVVAKNCLHGEGSSTKSRSHTLIDLNVPQVSIGFESNRPLITETVQNSDNSCPHVLFIQSEIMVQPESLKLPDKGAEVNQHPTMYNRRQSTRNRPLTTKALEALECGFFSPLRKRKAAQNNSRSVRGRPVVTALFRTGASKLNMEES